MTMRTGLVITGDSKGAAQALADIDRGAALAESGLDDLGAAAGRVAERTGSAARSVASLAAGSGAAADSASRYAAAYSTADAAIGRLAQVQAEATREINASKAALAAGAISLEQYNRELLETKSGLALIQGEYAQAMGGLKKANSEFANGGKQVVVSADQQRAGMQQLSYQIGDMTAMWSMGARPMQIFASQGGQVVQSIALMRGSAGGLIGFLGGPWGAVIMGAVTVLGTYVASMDDASASAQKVEFATRSLGDAQSILGSVMDLTTGKINTQSDALLALAKAQAIAGRLQAQARMAEARGKLASEAAPTTRIVGSFGGGLSIQKGRDVQGDVASAFLDGSLNTREAVAGLDSLRKSGYLTEKQFLDLAQSFTAFGVEAENVKVFADLEKALNGDVAATRQFLRVSKDHAKQSREKKAALTDEQKAYKRSNEETKRYIEGLEDEIAKIGQNAAGLRQLEVAKAKEAAATEAQRIKIEELSKTREKAIAIQEQYQRQERAQDYIKNNVLPLEMELKAMGMVGAEREKFLIDMEAQAKMLDAMAKGEFLLVQAILQEADARKLLVDQSDQRAREAEDIAYLNDQLRDMIDLLSSIGGLGNVIGGALGILTGQGGGFGGAFGQFTDSLLQQRTGEWVKDRETGREVAETIGMRLDKVFSQDGSFGKTLKGLLQGAGNGLLGGSLLGEQGTTGQLGSAIGGALGEKIGEKVLTKGFESIAKGLGQFAGPLGSIVGGLLGGLVGGMFKKTKKGSATIGGSGDDFSVEVSGNSASRKEAANKAAGAVIDAVREIADALGAGLDAGAGSVSVGVRKKSFRVDPTGQGRTKGAGVLDLGGDEEAALKAAIGVLIKQGVLTGLSQSIENLLKGDGDIEEQLKKALDMQGVFDWLAQKADPAGFALGQFGKEMERLEGVFAEAGASAEELAKLQQFGEERRKEIARAANEELNALRELEVQLMQLQGRATEALVLARQLETEGLTDAQRALQEQIYALTDAARLRELEIQLMEAEGRTREAELARREEYLKSLTEAEQVYQRQIYAALDAKQAQEDAAAAQQDYADALNSARSDLVSVYNRELSALQQTAERFRGLAQSLREFSASLYGADSGLASTRTLLVQLMTVGAQAATGNEAAMGNLEGVGREYLGGLLNTASTAQEYARGVALVANYANQAAQAAEGRVSSAERQIQLMEKQVGSLVDLSEGQLSLAEAMQKVKALLENPVVPAVPTPVVLPADYVSDVQNFQQRQIDALGDGFRENGQLLDRLLAKIDDLNNRVTAVATHTSTAASRLSAWDNGGRCQTVETA